MVVMKNWAVCHSGDEFLAPEFWAYFLTGNVYGHPRFSDGDLVDTSRIIDVRIEDDHKIVCTKNTEYAVYKDDVDPRYEGCYPNAYDRLSVAMSS